MSFLFKEINKIHLKLIFIQFANCSSCFIAAKKKIYSVVSENVTLKITFNVIDTISNN